MSLAISSARHLQAFLSSLGKLVRAPVATLLTLIVIALALALPTALRVFVINAQAATGNFASAVDMSVYLKTDVPLAKAQQLAQSAQQRSDVATVTLIPADQGLQEFRVYSGFGDALTALKENPLPHVLHVRPRAELHLRRGARVPETLLQRLAGSGPGAGGRGMGDALQRHPGTAAASARSSPRCSWASACSRSSATPSALRSRHAAPKSKSPSSSAVPTPMCAGRSSTPACSTGSGARCSPGELSRSRS